jgi:hypothetical protein
VKLRFLILLVAASIALAACLGNTGNPVAPPSDVRAVVGDGIVGADWTPQLGVNYLVFGANTPNMTTQNWTDAAINGFSIVNTGGSNSGAVPPAILCNGAPGYAVNGLTYYFTVDAHTGTSPAGPGSPLVQATPRAAGGPGTWSTGTPMNTSINGVGYTTISTCLATGKPTGIFNAVGPGGAIFSSETGANWAPRTPAGYTTDLYGVASFTTSVNNPAAPGLLIVAVGAGGAAIRSGDGVNWSPSVAFNASAPTLRAISWTGALFIAVGDGGRIQTSPDGIAWTIQTSNTTANLHSITCVGTTCLVVGDLGVVDITFDGGVSWGTNVLAGGSVALRGAVYGNFDNNETGNGVIGVGGNTPTQINTWVVVGDQGTAYQSTVVNPGVTASSWSSVPISGAANLVAVGYTTVFVAIDSAGNAFTSERALPGAWSAAVPIGITDPLKLATNSHGYVMVGSSGDNVSAF